MQLGKRLSSIRKRLAGNLPDPTETIRGSVVKYYLACGKQACRCHQGGPKHGPYYYLMTTLKPGKTRMVKLSAEQIKVAQTWVRNFKNYKKGLEKISQLNTRILQLDRKSEPGKSKRKRG